MCNALYRAFILFLCIMHSIANLFFLKKTPLPIANSVCFLQWFSGLSGVIFRLEAPPELLFGRAAENPGMGSLFSFGERLRPVPRSNRLETEKKLENVILMLWVDGC